MTEATVEALKQAYIKAHDEASEAATKERKAKGEYEAAFKALMSTQASSMAPRDIVRRAIESMETEGAVLYSPWSVRQHLGEGDSPLTSDQIEAALEELCDESGNIIKRDYRLDCCAECGENPMIGRIDSKLQVSEMLTHGVYCMTCHESFTPEEGDFRKMYVHASARS
jgi:hypothetical protein